MSPLRKEGSGKCERPGGRALRLGGRGEETGCLGRGRRGVGWLLCIRVRSQMGRERGLEQAAGCDQWGFVILVRIPRASPNGRSQHHFTLKNGVQRGVPLVCVLADSVTPRPSPGSGPGRGQGSGRNNEGESLSAAPTGTSSPAGSRPVRTLARPGGWRWLFGNIAASGGASSLFWFWPLPLLLAFQACSFLLGGQGASSPGSFPFW